jgi:hypothetical protein
MIEFYDETRKLVKCTTSDPSQSKVCYWDHHPFDGQKIACPIRYKPKQVVKTYKSEISNENYTIKENIAGNEHHSQSIISEVYEVDGMFCSPNCCLAFIQDNKHNRLYDRSELLLYKTLELGSTPINPAPHWRALIQYGGTLTIKEFRAMSLNFCIKADDTTLTEVKVICRMFFKTPSFI